MGIKVGDKVIPVSFLKVEAKRNLIVAKDQGEMDRTQVLKHLPGARKSKREQSKEMSGEELLVGGQNPGSVAPPRSKKGQERREQRRCQERSYCQ